MKVNKRKLRYYIILIAAVASFAAHHASSAPLLRAYGHIVGNFSRLDIAGTMNVDCRYNPDSTGYVILHTFPEFSKVLRVSNENGVLRLWTDADNIGTGYVMNVTVYSGSLEKIENGAAGRVTISSINLNRNSVFELKNNATGTCTVNAPVTSKTISIRNTGRGDLFINKPLEAQKATIISRSDAPVTIQGLSAVKAVIENNNNASLDISDVQATKIDVNNRTGGVVNIQRAIAPTLSVTNGGAGIIRISGLDSPDVNAVNNGAGSIILTGSAAAINVRNTSTGTIDTSALETGAKQ